MKDKKIVAGTILLIVLLFYLLALRMCQPTDVTIDITPTLVTVSPTSLLVASVTVTGTTPPTVTVTPLPSLTPTRLIPTSTITPTLTPTVIPSPTVSPTPADEMLLIVSGVTYWDSSKYKYNVYEKWICLRAINGWPERELPIGEKMRLPANCD